MSPATFRQNTQFRYDEEDIQGDLGGDTNRQDRDDDEGEKKDDEAEEAVRLNMLIKYKQIDRLYTNLLRTPPSVYSVTIEPLRRLTDYLNLGQCL